jgi:very-short-patch-repair endonuclease
MNQRMVHNTKEMKEVRRSLRKSLTPAEALLWKNLQRSQLAGKKFRRQQSIGRYVVDFYCPECRLAIELDGQVHFNSIRSACDAARSEFLKEFNIRVLRFENRQVFESLELVLNVIQANLTTPHPS